MDRCLDILSRSGSSSGVKEKDWMVLTDGEEDDSGGSNALYSHDALKARLRDVDVGVVIIGIGNEVQTEVARPFL